MSRLWTPIEPEDVGIEVDLGIRDTTCNKNLHITFWESDRLEELSKERRCPRQSRAKSPWTPRNLVWLHCSECNKTGSEHDRASLGVRTDRLRFRITFRPPGRPRMRVGFAMCNKTSCSWYLAILLAMLCSWLSIGYRLGNWVYWSAMKLDVPCLSGSQYKRKWYKSVFLA